MNCNRHKKYYEINKKVCNICVKETPQLNSYLNNSTNIITYFCDGCYHKHKTLFNNICIDKTQRQKNNMLFGCNISTIKQIMINTVNNALLAILNIHDSFFKNFLKQYENIIITKEILHEIKKNKYYNYDCLNDYDYKCFLCTNTNSYAERYICDICEELICIECCANDYNYEDDKLNLCTNCDDKINANFYNKYKNIILTKSVILENDFIFDLNEIENLGFKLQYECPNCDTVVAFSTCTIMFCTDCDCYVCNNCAIVTNASNNYNNYFYEHSTYYDHNRTVSCNICSYDEPDEIKKSISRPVSPCIETDDIDKQCNVCMINVKNYACIPCGHLCICGECSNKIDEKCPICNNKITSIVRIF